VNAQGGGRARGTSWPLTADPGRSCDPEHSRRRRETAEPEPLSLRPLRCYGRYGCRLQDQRARRWEVGPVDPSIPWPPHVGSFLSRSVGLLRLHAGRSSRSSPDAHGAARYGRRGTVKIPRMSGSSDPDWTN
jgi:hypothetical protein